MMAFYMKKAAQWSAESPGLLLSLRFLFSFQFRSWSTIGYTGVLIHDYKRAEG
jgi:hypothetical protein